MAKDQAPENFDSLYNGNRAFILGGVTFHWEPLHWREWGATIDARAAEEVEKEKKLRAELERLKGVGVPDDEAEIQADEIINDETLIQTYERLVDRAVIYVLDSEEESFRAVVNDPDKKVTIAQLNALLVWLQEVQTPERPTTPQPTSSSGAGKTGATSPAA
jgi:hypothetical protein